MFVTKIKSVLAVVLVVGLTFGGIGAGNGLSTTPAAVAQQPAGLPGGPGPAGAGAPPASGPEQKAKAKEIDWRIRALDEQIGKLRDLQKQAEQEAARLNKQSAALERTIGELLTARERFLKKAGDEKPKKGKNDDKSPEADALKRAELKQAESALAAAAAAAAAADVEVAKALAQIEAAKANGERAQAIYRLHKQALEKLREKAKGGMPSEGGKIDGFKMGAAKTGDQALDGLWEDIENKGGWLRFEGSTIKYHPAGELALLTFSPDGKYLGAGRPALTPDGRVIFDFTCRYNFAPTPMTIDIFLKDGTAHGIFVVERGTLFIALAKTGKERPTKFKRDDATTLFVLKRAAQGEGKPTPPKTTDEPGIGGGAPVVGVPPGGRIHVQGIVESVDAKKGEITVMGVSGSDVSSMMMLFGVASDQKPAKGGAADALLKVSALDSYPKLVNVPVRANADGVIGIGVGIGVGFAKLKLKMEDLKAGQVVQLELAPDRTTWFVVVYVRVVSEEKKEKKP